jgi:hypothetical protein
MSGSYWNVTTCSWQDDRSGQYWDVASCSWQESPSQAPPPARVIRLDGLSEDSVPAQATAAASEPALSSTS